MTKFYETSGLKTFDLSLTVNSYKDEKGVESDLKINYIMKAEYNDQMPAAPVNPPISFRLSETTAAAIGGVQTQTIELENISGQA
jgi:hypothetical protein